MTSVAVLFKIDTGYLSSIRTRNSTRENILYKCYKYKISSKVILSFIVPSTQAAFAICFAREILCFRKLPALGSSVHMLRFYKACSKKFLCWGRPSPESPKLAVEKDIHHLQDLYNFLLFRFIGSQTRVTNRPGINPTRSKRV